MKNALVAHYIENTCILPTCRYETDIKSERTNQGTEVAEEKVLNYIKMIGGEIVAVHP